jgi:hypothetical protein
MMTRLESLFFELRQRMDVLRDPYTRGWPDLYNHTLKRSEEVIAEIEEVLDVSVRGSRDTRVSNVAWTEDTARQIYKRISKVISLCQAIVQRPQSV